MKIRDGLLGFVREDSIPNDTIVPAYDVGYGFFGTGQTIVFLNPMTGLRVAGPVNIVTYDQFSQRLLVSSGVTVKGGTAIYLSGVQDECSPPKVTSELEDE